MLLNLRDKAADSVLLKESAALLAEAVINGKVFRCEALQSVGVRVLSEEELDDFEHQCDDCSDG